MAKGARNTPKTQSSRPRPAAKSAGSRDHANRLMALFASRRATVGVVGLGYVGLPLVRALHDAGYSVIGFDIDAQKVKKLKAGKPYLKHLGEPLVRALAKSRRFKPTSREQDLASCDAIAICVPTPLGKHLEPDLGFVEASTRMLARVIRPGTLVSLESTTYPGTTRQVCKPIFEAAGFKPGKDVFLVFSPEREDPGRAGVSTHSIPRLVGGLDAQSTRLGRAFYGAAISDVVAVSTAEVAESAKLLENIYRAVNIALVNELKPVLADMGIDIWEVIAAAATKPFGFKPFYPGPGLGGHCIPIDPYYLTFKAREYGHATRFIELAGEVNRAMPRHVVDRVVQELNTDGRPLRGARVLVCGVAYKPDIDDVRETPAAEIIELLRERGADVSYHDPHVPVFPNMRKYKLGMKSVPLASATLRRADCVLIVTDHGQIDWAKIAREAKLVVDTRNAMAKVKVGRGKHARIAKA